MSAARKVGLMVPANNTTMEGELTAWLSPGTRCVTIRIPRGKGLLTAESIPAYKTQALELARGFRRAGIDILAFGCTAASFIAGPAQESALTQELADAAGVPVVTTARAMVQALQDQGAHAIAVVTPYQDSVNRQIRLFLTDGGIHVRAFDSLYAKDVDALGRIDADAVAAMARKTMRPECDAMFIACSQLPTFAILEPLRAEFGRPVLSSIQATAWQIMRTLGT